MGSKDRPADNNLISPFIKKLGDVSFFQAVYLLERYYNQCAQVGYQGPAGSEVIRFCPDAGLGFPESDITSIEKTGVEGGERFKMVTTFLGLYGTVSPLPAFYSEEILWNSQDNDPIKGFLDIFHHRLLSLFYRSWTKYRHYILFRDDGRDQISQRIFSLMGLGTENMQEHMNLHPPSLLRYAGLFMQRTRSASGLRNIISDYFGSIPVKIKESIGQWLTIKEEQINAIGKANCMIGENFSIGGKVYDRMGKFRISIGPVEYEIFKRFLPDKKDYKDLVSIVRLYIRDMLDFDVELIIKKEEVPLFNLTSEDPVQLGWVTLSSQTALRDMSVIV